MKPYTELPELGALYLEDSYVLGIEARPGEVRFLMDFVLTPAHPKYHPALPEEQHCYRRGEMVFLGVSRLLWSEQGALPATDASGELDYGNVDTYEWGAHHRLTGDWGRMEVVAREVKVELP